MSDSAPKRSRKPTAEPATKRAEKPAATTASVPHGDVARRAYEKYAARGFTHGQDSDDWLQAAKELEAERTDALRRSRPKKRR